MLRDSVAFTMHYKFSLYKLAHWHAWIIVYANVGWLDRDHIGQWQMLKFLIIYVTASKAEGHWRAPVEIWGFWTNSLFFDCWRHICSCRCKCITIHLDAGLTSHDQCRERMSLLQDNTQVTSSVLLLFTSHFTEKGLCSCSQHTDCGVKANSTTPDPLSVVITTAPTQHLHLSDIAPMTRLTIFSPNNFQPHT